jgi:phage terminase large subunit-like protein
MLVSPASDLLVAERQLPAYVYGEGARVRRFGEHYIVQTKGRWAGQKIEHQPWQRSLTDELFLRRPNGERVYKEALVGISRKNGKSTLGAELSLYGLMGTKEHSPEVYAAAASRDQAGIVFGQAKQFVEASPPLHDYLRPQRSTILCKHNNGVFRVLASDAPLQYGLNPSMVVIDELWAHKNSELYYALTTGQLARLSPLVVSITTAGFDRDSICYEKYEYGRKLRDQGGIEAMREEGFLFWWYEMPAALIGDDGETEPLDYRDERFWKAANPSDWITVENLRRESRRLPESVFRRLHLNQWTESEDAWIKPYEWDALRWQGEDPYKAVEAMPARSPKHKRLKRLAFERLKALEDAGQLPVQGLFLNFDLPTWFAVDVGIRRDSAAIVAAQFHGEKLHVRGTILIPSEEGERWGVADVRAKVRDVTGQFSDAREVNYDPWSFRESAELLAEDGLPMVEFPQTGDRMGPASETLYEVVVENRLRQEGDEEARKQALAAVVGATERGGWRISKRKSLERIDFTIALAMAVDRAVTMQHVKPKRGGRIY